VAYVRVLLRVDCDLKVLKLQFELEPGRLLGKGEVDTRPNKRDLRPNKFSFVFSLLHVKLSE
jgi:hypothetical protein